MRSNDTVRKQFFTSYDIGAGVIILLGVGIRLGAIAAGWPAPYNDEGTVGLMARHIAYRGAHPLLYYGQDYMGSLEAYLGAAFFQVFGPSTFALRLGLLLLFALFLFCLYLLAKLVYPKSLVLFSLLLLALGAPEVIFRQLMTAGGPPDYFFFTTLLLLVTAWLILTLPPAQTRLSRVRLLGYAAWGGVAGLAIWSHLLCLPFVACAGLTLLFFCRRELRFSVLLLLALTLLLGASPLIVYKVAVPVSNRENSLFAGVFGGGYREPSYPPVKNVAKQDATISPKPIPPLPGQQIIGTILVAIPVATNGTALCPIAQRDAWPLTNQTTPYTYLCTGVHGAWGLGYIALLVLAILSAVRALRTNLRSVAAQEERSVKAEYEARLQGVRLMILSGAAATLLAFMFYPQAAAVTPWNSARYLVGLLIATPAILYPLWRKLETLRVGQTWKERLGLSARYVTLLLIFGTCLFGTVILFTSQVAQAGSSFSTQQRLISRLLQRGDTHVYMDYDDCNRISFLSNEQIICAALDKGLQPGLDRYYPYRQMVAESPHPAYVLLDNSTQAILFEQKAAQQQIAYQKSAVGRYIIYEPASRLPS